MGSYGLASLLLYMRGFYPVMFQGMPLIEVDMDLLYALNERVHGKFILDWIICLGCVVELCKHHLLMLATLVSVVMQLQFCFCFSF